MHSSRVQHPWNFLFKLLIFFNLLILLFNNSLIPCYSNIDNGALSLLFVYNHMIMSIVALINDNIGCSLCHSSLTSPYLLTLSGTCSYHLSFFCTCYFSHNFQRTIFALLSCLCLYSLWANLSVTLTDNMLYNLAFLATLPT